MDLIHNATFRLLSDDRQSLEYEPGIYRVIADLRSINKTVTVLIHAEASVRRPKGGRPKSARQDLKRKKPPQPLVGNLIWMDTDVLLQQYEAGLLKPIDVEREAILALAPIAGKARHEYERRLAAMAGFLDVNHSTEQILIHRGLGGLVREAMDRAKVCRSFVYKQWSTLCRLGIHEHSLRPRHDRSGAPGVARPCGPQLRQKAGRKTLKQRIARAYGRDLEPEQPGMTAVWAAAIRAADKRIPQPKPSWKKRCDAIVLSAFATKGREVNGVFELIKPAQGSYPNDQQIKRVLTVDRSRLDRLLERTTRAHFSRALRGLVARHWRGTSGPCHTWAIDSTVADTYLRSSVNRAWIIGRPIVYVVVDVWSTAVVGFYVCLTGPSWKTAAVALFNATADPSLLGELWGYQVVETLHPRPTLCHNLLSDRGEILSQAHRHASMKLIPVTSYTPPYRGDLKGLAEVLHRIEKDAQFLFLPGAMNFRREELELRRVDPNECVLTLREYVSFLHEVFAEYNLTADRRHRVDAHMEASGVYPSPAGLWSWACAMGLAVRRHTDVSDLIMTLLPGGTGRVTRESVRFANCDYSSEIIRTRQWTALSRNFGGWNLPVHHYPGSMARIWTPNESGAGMLELTLSPESKVSSEVSFEEHLDWYAHQTMRQADVRHQNKMAALDFLNRRNALIKASKRLTYEAIDRASGIAPSMTEARLMEVASSNGGAASEAKTRDAVVEDAALAHQSMMDDLLRTMQEDA